MTVTFYPDLIQGSDEWLAARCGVLTASTIGKLITPSTLKVASNDTSRALTETLVAERISGHVEYVHPTWDMQRGTFDEPAARDLYAQHYAPVEEVGFATRDIGGYTLGASPDGLVGDDGGIEIKSRRGNSQLRTILSDTVPSSNMAQIQCLLLVLDREWWDYISYAEGWPLYVKRVHPDPRWQNALRDALASFEKRAAEMMTAFTAARRGPVAPRTPQFIDADIRL